MASGSAGGKFLGQLQSFHEDLVLSPELIAKSVLSQSKSTEKFLIKKLCRLLHPYDSFLNFKNPSQLFF